MREYEKALVSINEALRINPNDGIAWYAKYEALNNSGRSGEAIECFNKAKQLGAVS
jgi:tetratricopeptide (TPR) repeat protein